MTAGGQCFCFCLSSADDARLSGPVHKGEPSGPWTKCVMTLTPQIFGIGKSYRHNWPNLDANDPLPEPLVFLKPATSIIRPGQSIEVPRGGTCIQEGKPFWAR